MFNLSTSAKDTNELSTRLDRGHVNRERKLAEKKKKLKGKNHVRFMLSDVYDFAKHPEQAKYLLG